MPSWNPSGTRNSPPGTRRCSITTWGRSPNRQDRKSAPSSTTRARPSPTCKPERAPTSRSTTSRCGSSSATTSNAPRATCSARSTMRSPANRAPASPSLRRPPRRSTAPWSTTWPCATGCGCGRRPSRRCCWSPSPQPSPTHSASGGDCSTAGGNWPSPMPNSVKRTGS